MFFHGSSINSQERANSYPHQNQGWLMGGVECLKTHGRSLWGRMTARLERTPAAVYKARLLNRNDLSRRLLAG